MNQSTPQTVFLFPRFKLLAVAWLAALALAACGGGSGGAADPSAGSTPSEGTAPPSQGGGATTPNPVPSPAPGQAADLGCQLPDFAQDMLDRVNAVRTAGAVCRGVAQAKVPALTWNTQLSAAAAKHSQDMVSAGFFDHTGSDGKEVDYRVTAQGYKWSDVGENIAAGQRSSHVVMDAWLGSSDGHCEAIMSSSYTQVGVACVLKPNDPQRYNYYWTMVLARPQ